MADSIIFKQNLGVNPFGKQAISIDRKPEIVEKINIERISEKINSAYEKYKKISYYNINGYKRFTYDNWNLNGFNQEILSPVEINLLLNIIIEQTDKIRLNPLTGYYMSRLIQDSYRAGNNNFDLIANDCRIDHLFNGLRGTKQNPISAAVYGNAGNFFGNDVHCGALKATGSMGYLFGRTSLNTLYTINILPFSSAAMSTDISKSTDCFYRTENIETYKSLSFIIDKKNFVYLVDEDMKIKDIRRF